MSNCWLKCTDTRDTIPLSRSHGLYLKPVALLHISVQLPQLRPHGKAISDWEIMEKMKHWIKPEEFTTLKVSKKTLEFVRFEAEIQNKSKLHTVLGRLDGKSIKISGFSEELKVRAVESKGDFPTKYDWDSFFRDAKDMNEMKAGERPDTVYLSNLPCKWFNYGTDVDKPSEHFIRKVFEQFGEIKRIDLPMLDVYRNKMNNSISGVRLFTFNKDIVFEVYIQYKEYFCFVKCMDAFRGMKLVHMNDSKNAYCASIKVDFDRSKHLSDASIHRREIVRERLIKKDKERMEAEMKKKQEEEQRLEQERLQKIERRKLREHRRKEKQLEKLKLKEVDDMSTKIATEEYLLLLAQRKLESIRLLGELLNRLKNEKERHLVNRTNRTKKNRSHDNDEKGVEEQTKMNDCTDDEAGLGTEKDLRYKLIQKFKKMQQRELVKEKVKLKSLVTDDSNPPHKFDNGNAMATSSGSDTERLLDDRTRSDNYYNDRRGRYGRQPRSNYYRGGRDRSFFTRTNMSGEDFQNSRGRFQRGGRRNFGSRSSYQNSLRTQYPGPMVMPFMDPVLLSYSHEYYKYLRKIARESQRSRRSSSSRSYSRSRSRSRSRSYCSRSRSRTRSRSRRSYSRRRSSSRSRSRSWSRSRTRTRSRSKQRPLSAIEKPTENVIDQGVENSKNDAEKNVIDNAAKDVKEKSSHPKKHKKKKKKKTKNDTPKG